MRGSTPILATAFLWSLAAGAAQVENVRTWPAPDHTRVVFDLDAPVEYTVFALKDPERVVVDLPRTRLATRIGEVRPGPLLRRIRSAAREDRDLRVVLDVRSPVRWRSFPLEPNARYGHRLVVDLYPKDADGTRQRVEVPAGAGDPRPREVIVAVDPGHGGEDPGAVTSNGTREKDVVLALSRELKKAIDRRYGMRAVLIREDDYYVALRRRMEFARRARADLFVSVHADAFRDPRVHGASVYVISRRGESSEAARWLADRENAADFVGGVSLHDREEMLARVLLDLSQETALSASTEAGARVLAQLGGVGKLHKRHIERAGFLVLKSPDIPSILVETGFLTNPQDERRLNDRRAQRAIAAAIADGIAGYFEDNPPPATLLAAPRHLIARGDTLSGIAERYRVPLADLRAWNGIRGDLIRVGDTLAIPGG